MKSSKRCPWCKRDFPLAAFEDHFVAHFDAEQMRDDLGRAIVIAVDPGNLDPVRKLAEQRQHLPVMFLQPAKIDGIENVAVEDKPLCEHLAVENVFQEMRELPGLAVFASEMDVGNDDGIVARGISITAREHLARRF